MLCFYWLLGYSSLPSSASLLDFSIISLPVDSSFRPHVNKRQDVCTIPRCIFLYACKFKEHVWSGFSTQMPSLCWYEWANPIEMYQPLIQDWHLVVNQAKYFTYLSLFYSPDLLPGQDGIFLSFDDQESSKCTEWPSLTSYLRPQNLTLEATM